MTMLRKVFYKTSERTLKMKNIFFGLNIFSLSLKYEYRKGLYQVDFWVKTQAG